MDKSGKGKKKEEGIARRKRNRETQDIEAPLVCDVCMKEKGQGGIVAKDGKTSIDFSVEVSSRRFFQTSLTSLFYFSSSYVLDATRSTNVARIVEEVEEGGSGESFRFVASRVGSPFSSTLAHSTSPSPFFLQDREVALQGTVRSRSEDVLARPHPDRSSTSRAWSVGDWRVGLVGSDGGGRSALREDVGG